MQLRHQHKLNQLSSEQERPLFEVHNTVHFHDIDIVPPRYVLDTLSLGPKNAVLDRFTPYGLLAELDLVLNKCQRNHVIRETINDINFLMVKYIKEYSKQVPPRHLRLTQEFHKKHNLLAIPFDKGTGFCVMKAETYEKKLLDILNLSQFEKVENTRKNAKDAVLKEEERICKTIKNLQREGQIDKELSLWISKSP